MSKVLIVDDSDAGVVYTGSWTTLASVASNTNEYKSTVHKSGAAGGKLSYEFFGTGISVYGTLDVPVTNGAPSAKFAIDGGTPVGFNTTGTVLVDRPDIATSHTLLYSAQGLARDSHKLVITRPPTATSRDAPLYIDFFTVATGSDVATGDIIVDERDASISYTGGPWVDNGIRAEYLGTTRQSPSAANGGSAMFRFNGTAITVYGTTASTTGASTTSNMEFSIDDISRSAFTGPQNAPAILHTTLFQIAGLSNDQEHALVIKTLNPNPWFLDYMVYTTENSSVSGGGSKGGGGSSPGKGAIVGAVIAGIIGVLALAGIVFLLLRRRTAKRKQEVDYEGANLVNGTQGPFPVPFTNSGGFPNADARAFDDTIPATPFVSTGVNGLIPPSKGGASRGTAQAPTIPSYPGGGISAHSSTPPAAGSQYMDGSAYSGIERDLGGSHPAHNHGYGSPPHNNPLYPQFDASGGRRGGPPSAHSSSPHHYPSSTTQTRMSSTFEQDSGIRIPAVLPPQYTVD